MTLESDYHNLINEIVAKQIVILGPSTVLLKAKNIQGLKLNDAGKVVSIDGDPQQVLQNLVNEYILLSGQIVKNILNPVFAKYPHIKVAIN